MMSTCVLFSSHWKNVHYVHIKKGYKVISKADNHYIVKKPEYHFYKRTFQNCAGTILITEYLNTHADKNETCYGI